MAALAVRRVLSNFHGTSLPPTAPEVCALPNNRCFRGVWRFATGVDWLTPNSVEAPEALLPELSVLLKVRRYRPTRLRLG